MTHSKYGKWILTALLAGLLLVVALPVYAQQTDATPTPEPTVASTPESTPTPEPTAAPTPTPTPSYVVDGVEIVSDPGSDGYYVRGDYIDIRVTFPALYLEQACFDTLNFPVGVGNTQRKAYHHAGSTYEASAAQAVYRIDLRGPGDDDHDGISIPSGAIFFNVFGVGQGRSCYTPPDMIALSTDADHKVDMLDPLVTGATVSEDGGTVTITLTESISPPALLTQIAELFDFPISLFYRAVLTAGHVTKSDLEISDVTLGDSEIVLTVSPTIGRGDQIAAGYSNIFARDAVGLFRDAAGKVLQPTNYNYEATNNSAAESQIQSPHLEPSPRSGLTVLEGGSATFTLWTPFHATGDRTVTFSTYPSGKLTVSPSTLTLTPENYRTPQTVTVTAAEDDDSYNYWTRITMSGVGPDLALLVVIDDNDD